MDDDNVRRRILIASIVMTLRHIINMINTILIILDDTPEVTSLDSHRIQYRTILRSRRPSVQNYVFHIVPTFSDRQFQEHFRMIPSTFAVLESMIGEQLTNSTRTGRSQIPIRKQILATIWLLATPDSYRSIADRFDMSKSCLYYCGLRVVKVLCSISSQTIKWPTQSEIEYNKRKIQRCYGFPDVVGAVDGCYIFINKPKEHGNAYNTRKCRYAIVLQAIADVSKKFIDCFAGYPGSVGDFRIFRNSDIYRTVNQNKRQFFPNNEHLLGDKAYPLLDWCITPFRDNGRLSTDQRRYNVIHSSARAIIERAFALLKGRFRRLKGMEIIRVDQAPFYILASCVLHNMCLNIGGEDLTQYFDQNFNPTDSLSETNEPPQSSDGILKRTYLCNILNRIPNPRI